MQTAQTQQAIVVTLSDDELTFCLRMLGIARLASFLPSKEYNASAEAAASRSLRAHGLATLSEDGVFQLEEAVAKLIVAGASFSRLIAITHENNGRRSHAWFYLIPGLAVMHRQPEPGTHAFQTVPEGMSLLLLLASAMGMAPLRDGSPGSEAETIPKSRYHALIQPGEEVSFQPETAISAGLQDALTEPIAQSAVTLFIPKEEEQADHASLLVIDTAKGYWLLVPSGDDFIAKPMEGQQVLERIADLLMNSFSD
jgi:hypothetical protein